MKKGLLCLAAILAAFMFTTATYADTTVVIAGTDPRGVSVTTDANNAPYVSGKTATTSAAVFTTAKAAFDGTTTSRLNGAIASNDGQNFRMTAVALGFVEDSAIVVGVSNDTEFAIYIEDTSGNLNLHGLFGVRTANPLGTKNGDSALITSVAAAANDSVLLVVISVTPTKIPTANNGITVLDSGIIAYLFRLTTTEIFPVDTVFLSGSKKLALLAPDLQIELSKAEGADRTTDTFTCFYVLANVTADSGNPNTDSNLGVWIFKVYADTSRVITTSSVKVDTGAGSNVFSDAALQVERVSSSDTRDRLTVLLVGSGGHSQNAARLNDTYILVEVSTDSHAAISAGKGPSLNSLTDAGGAFVTEFDTGIESLLGQGRFAQSIAFHRSGSSINFLAIMSTGDLQTISGSLDLVRSGPTAISSAKSLTLTSDTVGTNTGYNANTVFSTNVEELAQADRSGVTHVAGINDSTDHIFYLSFGGGESSKKKDSGVCLMDRMFGKTSLRAAFPALKTFRDTLLGTDMGRKVVSLYYSF
ncbi:hypothetical protein HY522_07845 [bacterium]|nr:hypothetical protein [bacterium]